MGWSGDEGGELGLGYFAGEIPAVAMTPSEIACYLQCLHQAGLATTTISTVPGFNRLEKNSQYKDEL